MNCICFKCKLPIDCNEALCPLCGAPTGRYVYDEQAEGLVDGYPRYDKEVRDA